MSKRRLYCTIALFVIFACLIVVYVVASDSGRITRQKLESVQEGMTLEEVIRTVGQPPGNHANGRCVSMPHGLRYWNYESWLCDEGQLLVLFDADGIATDVAVYDVINFGPPTLFEQIKRLFGL